MTPESLLLKYFIRDREHYTKYGHIMSSTVLDKEFATIFKTIEKYYDTIPTHNYISMDEFNNFFGMNNSTLKDKDLILELVKQIYDVDVSSSLIMEVVKNLVEKDVANKIVQKLLPTLTENKFGVMASIDEDIKQYQTLINRSERLSPFDETPLDELIQEHVTGGGLHWRMECLMNDIGVLRPGYLGHMMARPDTGKTSFLCSELGFMAGQLEDEESIIWFGNEERTGRIKLRLYSAILDAPMDKIINNKDKALQVFDERGGNKIKLIGQSTSLTDIRNTCFEYKPRLIIIDSADKVSFPGCGNMEGPAKLKELYWRYRQLADEFNTTCLTVAQASGEAAGKKWLEMHHMDFSKTGKAAEMDFIIGIGRTLDGEEDNIRYLHIPKNKLNGLNGRWAVHFNPRTGRYSDMQH